MAELNTAALAVSAGAASTVVATWVQRFSIEIFGVPLAVVVAAFAGACVILTALPTSSYADALKKVISGTLAGAFFTPIVSSSLCASINQSIMGTALCNDSLSLSVRNETGLAFALGLVALILIEAAVDVIRRLPADIREKWLNRNR